MERDRRRRQHDDERGLQGNRRGQSNHDLAETVESGYGSTPRQKRIRRLGTRRDRKGGERVPRLRRDDWNLRGFPGHPHFIRSQAEGHTYSNRLGKCIQDGGSSLERQRIETESRLRIREAGRYSAEGHALPRHRRGDDGPRTYWGCGQGIREAGGYRQAAGHG